MKRAYVDIPEGQIHYRTEGTGEPLLLLHQTPTSSDEYSDIIPALAGKYRVIAMDTLGYGSSDHPSEKPAIELYGRSVAHFLDALDIPKTNIVGNLTGSWIAVDLATAFPERVDKLVLGGVFLTTPEEDEASLEHVLFRPMEITEDGSFVMELWNFYRKAAPQMKVSNAYRILVSALQAGPDHYIGHIAVNNYDKAPRLPLIKNKTMLLYSASDMFYAKREVIISSIPECEAHVFEGKTFNMYYEKPEEVAGVILKFLEK